MNTLQGESVHKSKAKENVQHRLSCLFGLSSLYPDLSTVFVSKVPSPGGVLQQSVITVVRLHTVKNEHTVKQEKAKTQKEGKRYVKGKKEGHEENGQNGDLEQERREYQK